MNYKHKGSDFILKTNKDGLTLDMYDCEDKMICKGVPQSMVILGNDREEIKEEDYIDEIIKNFLNINGIELNKRQQDILYHIIEKSLPLITDDMIEKISAKIYEDIVCHDWVNTHTPKENIKFLIKQNLPKDLLANPL